MDRWTGGQTDRQTERKMNRQTNRDTEKQRALTRIGRERKNTEKVLKQRERKKERKD